MTETTTEKPVLKMGSASDIAESLPYLLGYQPHERLVVLCAGAHRRVGLIMAVDLTDLVGSTDARLRAEAVHLAKLMTGDGAATAILVQVSEGTDIGLVTHLHVAAQQAGIRVVDVLLSRGGTVTSLNDLEGPEQIRLTEVSATLAAVYGPVGERIDLIDPLGVRALTEDERDAQLEALVEVAFRVHTDIAGLAAQTVAWLAGDDEPTLADAPTYIGALRDAPIRDLSMSLLTGDHNTRTRAMERLGWLASVAPGKFRAAPATLFGVGGYLGGNGAQLGLALDAALEADPTYSLALLMQQVYAAAMPPSVLREMLDEAIALARADFDI